MATFHRFEWWRGSWLRGALRLDFPWRKGGLVDRRAKARLDGVAETTDATAAAGQVCLEELRQLADTLAGQMGLQL